MVSLSSSPKTSCTARTLLPVMMWEGAKPVWWDAVRWMAQALWQNVRLLLTFWWHVRRRTICFRWSWTIKPWGVDGWGNLIFSNFHWPRITETVHSTTLDGVTTVVTKVWQVWWLSSLWAMAEHRRAGSQWTTDIYLGSLKTRHPQIQHLMRPSFWFVDSCLLTVSSSHGRRHKGGLWNLF